MAITVANTDLNNPAGLRVRIVKLTPDASHLAAGEAVTPAQFGFSEQILWAQGVSNGGIVWRYTASAGTVRAYWVDTTVDGAGLTAVPDATDLSADPVELLAVGR